MISLQRAGLALGAYTLIATPAPAVRAADHVDSPAVVADPAADITDVYAWVDAGNLNLILNIPAAGPDAVFSDAVQYVFHLEASDAYGAAGAESIVLCTFDAGQQVRCWVGENSFVSGDASNPSGLTSDDGRVRVFAGVRNDPFFFNLSGFNATIDAVVAAAPNLAFDDAGCPALDAATSGVLVGQLSAEPDATEARDDFAGGAVLSLVVQLDPALVEAEDRIVAVWASTRR
jgi:hypothetical protein